MQKVLEIVYLIYGFIWITEHADNYQTNWEDYYNHAEHQPTTPTNNKQEFLNFLSQYAIKNKQDLFGGLADMDVSYRDWYKKILALK